MDFRRVRARNCSWVVVPVRVDQVNDVEEVVAELSEALTASATRAVCPV